MKEVVDKVSKRWIHVEVTEPVTITTKQHLGWTSSYTSYLIRIENNHWAFTLANSQVRRRFSEFCWLRAKLQEHHPSKIVPPLPPKHLLHVTNFDPILINERCLGLEKFLQRVLRSFVFLSDAALHLFLQSDLTIKEIESKLVEEIQPKVNYTKSDVPSVSDKIDIIKKVKTHVDIFNGSCSSGSSSRCSGSITSGELEYDDHEIGSCSSSGVACSLSDTEEKELDDEHVKNEFNVIPSYINHVKRSIETSVN